MRKGFLLGSLVWGQKTAHGGLNLNMFSSVVRFDELLESTASWFNKLAGEGIRFGKLMDPNLKSEGLWGSIYIIQPSVKKNRSLSVTLLVTHARH